MTIQIGEKIPSLNLVKATADGPEPLDTGAFFSGRKVALFSVPGAFTPACSAKHLPSFVANYDALKAKGVDEIACTAVNDPFVLAAWAKSQEAEGKVTMIADGNGDLAKALGLTLDGSKFGLGQRGSRWSALVEDGVVTQLNLEEGGAYSVSGAETLLEQL